MPLLKAQSRSDFTKYLTYLLQAGAPHARRRGPCCFSLPPVQVSAYLDALLRQRTSSPAVQVRQECRAPECLYEPYRSCFFVWVASATGLNEHRKQTLFEKIKRKTQINNYIKNNNSSLGLRDARLEVDLEFRDVSPSLPSLPASPSRHSASQTRWVRSPRCSPPLSNIIGHILGLALLENKDGPC